MLEQSHVKTLPGTTDFGGEGFGCGFVLGIVVMSSLCTKTSCSRPTLLMFRVQNMATWAFADMTKKATGKLVRVAHRMGV